MLTIWRWVIAIASVALIIWALQTSASVAFFSGISSTVSGWADAVFGASERRELRGLQDRFLINNMSLKPHQTDYIYEVTASFDNVRIFHEKYCVAKDKNPYLFGSNLMKFCSDIQQFKILPKEKS